MYSSSLVILPYSSSISLRVCIGIEDGIAADMYLFRNYSFSRCKLAAVGLYLLEWIPFAAASINIARRKSLLPDDLLLS